MKATTFYTLVQKGTEIFVYKIYGQGETAYKETTHPELCAKDEYIHEDDANLVEVVEVKAKYEIIKQ